MTRPEWIGFLRRDHTAAAGQLDEYGVPPDATRGLRQTRIGPKLVIAGNPDELGKARRQNVEGKHELRLAVAHIAGQDQPVLRPWHNPLDGAPIEVAAEMQIADRPELHVVTLSSLIP